MRVRNKLKRKNTLRAKRKIIPMQIDKNYVTFSEYEECWRIQVDYKKANMRYIIDTVLPAQERYQAAIEELVAAGRLWLKEERFKIQQFMDYIHEKESSIGVMFGDALKIFLSKEFQLGLTNPIPPTTLRKLRSIAKCWLYPNLSQIPVESLSGRDFEQLADKMRKEGKSEITISKVIGAYNSFHQRWPNPSHRPSPTQYVIIGDTSSQSEPDPFTEEELKRLIEAAPTYVFSMILLVWANTGMRQSELYALDWEDLDTEHNKIYIHKIMDVGGKIYEKTKTRYSKRHVQLPHTTVQELIAFRNSLPRVYRDGAMWLYSDTRERIYYNEMVNRTEWEDTLRLAKVRYRPKKCIRQSYISISLANNVNHVFLAKQVGHRKLDTMLTYYAKWIGNNDEELSKTPSLCLANVTPIRKAS